LENSYAVVTVTAGNRKEAEKIAQDLLDEKLITCANIIGPEIIALPIVKGFTVYMEWLDDCLR